MSLRLVDIPYSFHLPRPNWPAIERWVEKQIAEPDRQLAWLEVADQWLDSLNIALGNRYRLLRGRRSLLFVPSP